MGLNPGTAPFAERSDLQFAPAADPFVAEVNNELADKGFIVTSTGSDPVGATARSCG